MYKDRTYTGITNRRHCYTYNNLYRTSMYVIYSAQGQMYRAKWSYGTHKYTVGVQWRRGNEQRHGRRQCAMTGAHVTCITMAHIMYIYKDMLGAPTRDGNVQRQGHILRSCSRTEPQLKLRQECKPQTQRQTVYSETTENRDMEANNIQRQGHMLRKREVHIAEVL